jgi:hypothetical protein
MMACSILTLILGGTIMLHRMNQRPNFILLVVLACVAIALSTGLQTSSSAPVVLRGTDVGKFTLAPTSDPHVVVASDQAAVALTSVGRFTVNTGEHINPADPGTPNHHLDNWR